MRRGCGRLTTSGCQRPGGVKASSPAFLPQSWASWVQEMAKGPTSQRLLSNYSLGRRPQGLEGDGGAELSAEL